MTQIKVWLENNKVHLSSDNQNLEFTLRHKEQMPDISPQKLMYYLTYF